MSEYQNPTSETLPIPDLPRASELPLPVVQLEPTQDKLTEARGIIEQQAPQDDETETVAKPEVHSQVAVPFEGRATSHRSRKGYRLQATTITNLGMGADQLTAQHAQPSNEARQLELPAAEAGRLREFFNKNFANPPEGRYNCHYFGYEIAGWPGGKPPESRLGGLMQAIQTGELNMVYQPDEVEAVAMEPNKKLDLEPGAIYGIGDQKKDGKFRISHTFIGLSDGDSLSVLGVGKAKPLVVADAGELAQFYHGNVLRIKEPSKQASSIYTPSSKS